jgi:hypothetical protein
VDQELFVDKEASVREAALAVGTVAINKDFSKEVLDKEVSKKVINEEASKEVLDKEKVLSKQNWLLMIKLVWPKQNWLISR